MKKIRIFIIQICALVLSGLLLGSIVRGADIADSCTNSGQFTFDGVTYTCAKE